MKMSKTQWNLKISNYRNNLTYTTNGSQKIWTRVEAFRNGQLVEECIYIGSHLELTIIPIPQLPDTTDNLELCDNDFDGKEVFDLRLKRLMAFYK